MWDIIKYTSIGIMRASVKRKVTQKYSNKWVEMFNLMKHHIGSKQRSHSDTLFKSGKLKMRKLLKHYEKNDKTYR